MRTLLKIAFQVAFAAAVAGCAETEKFLRTTPSSIELAADVLEADIAVESSSAAWMVESPAVEWIAWQYASGGTSLKVVVAAPNEEAEARSTEVNFASGDGVSTIVPITQLAMTDPRFDLIPASPIAFDSEGGTAPVLTVDTNLADWNHTLLAREGWLTVGAEKGTMGGTLTITAGASQQFDQRRDTLVATPTNPAYAHLADSILIVQQGGLELAVASEEGTWLSATDAVELPAEGSETKLTVFAKAPWTVSIDPALNGAVLDKTGGEAAPQGVPLTLTVERNDALKMYAFKLVFECAGKRFEYNFRQAGAVSGI